MNTNELAQVAASLSIRARLEDVALFAWEGELLRAERLASILERLPPGAYLLGTGPYTLGVYALTTEEVVIGRLATPGEDARDVAIDILVNDTPDLHPREVSRVHATVYRCPEGDTVRHFVADCGSTTGTFVGGEELEKPAPNQAEPADGRQRWRALASGDVISLGPSHVNTFVFVTLPGPT
jgi:hypothetical protein